MVREKNVDYTNLRYMRTGEALFWGGIYLMFLASTLMVPSKAPRNEQEESWDYNIWKPHWWKRSKLIVASLFIIVLMNYMIPFSASAIFGNYIFYCIVGYKVLQAILEFVLIKTLKCQFLMSPVAICADMVGYIITFGANDFLVFLQQCFTDTCVLMIERTYFSTFVNYASEKLEESYHWMKTRILARCYPRDKDQEKKSGKDSESDSSDLENSKLSVSSSSSSEDAKLPNAGGRIKKRSSQQVDIENEKEPEEDKSNHSEQKAEVRQEDVLVDANEQKEESSIKSPKEIKHESNEKVIPEEEKKTSPKANSENNEEKKENTMLKDDNNEENRQEGKEEIGNLDHENQKEEDKIEQEEPEEKAQEKAEKEEKKVEESKIEQGKEEEHREEEDSQEERSHNAEPLLDNYNSFARNNLSEIVTVIFLFF